MSGRMKGRKIKRQMKGMRGGREKDTVVLSSGHRVINDNFMSLNYEVALYFLKNIPIWVLNICS